jgi:NAD(P)-dependent dehydrogenase (short-subunit alcohol dehydrogenase family)
MATFLTCGFVPLHPGPKDSNAMMAQKDARRDIPERVQAFISSSGCGSFSRAGRANRDEARFFAPHGQGFLPTHYGAADRSGGLFSVLKEVRMNTLQRPINSGFGAASTAKEVVAGIRLDGKRILITGGHWGIGLETTRALSEAGASITVGARNVSEAGRLLSGIANVDVLELDLSEPASVDRFAERFRKAYKTCDILINNAGIMATPLSRNSQGHELQFATNHLGHFRLTGRLWTELCDAQARVVCLTSSGHRYSHIDFADPDFERRPYDKWIAYGQSKTANALFAVQLDAIGMEAGVRAFAVHPGWIAGTNLGRFMTDQELASFKGMSAANPQNGPYRMKSVPEGAATSVWAATSPKLKSLGGVYCADCDISPMVPDDSNQPNGVHTWAIDPGVAERLWDMSERMSGFTWPQAVKASA